MNFYQCVLVFLTIVLTSLANTPTRRPTQSPTLSPTRKPLGSPSVEDVNLVSFTMNAGYGYFVLSFDRAVAASTLDASKMRIQKNAFVPVSKLNSTDLVLQFSSDILTFEPTRGNVTDVYCYLFSQVYAVMVATTTICRTATNCYFSMSRGAVLSSINYPNVVINSTSAFPVTTFLPNKLSPFLERYSVDMNAGILTLEFNVPIVPETFTMLGIAAQSVSNAFSAGIYIKFFGSGAKLLQSDNLNRNLTVSLGTSNMNLIKQNVGLWNSRSNTYLSAWQPFVNDSYSNVVSLPPLDLSHGMLVTGLIPDSTPSRLLSWDMNSNDGSIVLTFDETVYAQYFNSTGVCLQSSMDGALNVSYVRLFSPKGISTANSNTIIIYLSESQITALQLSNGIGTIQNSSFLTLDAGSIVDTAAIPNKYLGLDATSLKPMRVRFLIPNTTPPQVLRISFDMTKQTMRVVFSSVVSLQTVLVSAMTLQSQVATSVRADVLPLSSSLLTLTSSRNNFFLDFKMQPLMFNTLKAFKALGLSLNTTFFANTRRFVSDVSIPPNQVLLISTASAKQINTFIPDRVAPFLTSWYMDMSLSQLFLTFSEPMDIVTFDVTRILLRSELVTTRATMSVQLMSSYVLSLNYLTVVVQMSRADANSIKLKPPLCLSASTCILSFDSNLGVDTPTYLSSQSPVQNRVIAVTGELSSIAFVPDYISPELQSFSVDMNAGMIHFTFDEPVIFSDSSGIILYSDVTRINSYTLSKFCAGDGSKSINISVVFTRQDYINIKLTSPLFTSISESYLGLLGKFVEDMSGNPALPIAVSAAYSFVDDATPPSISAFYFNRTTENITVFFDDCVNPLTAKLSSFAMVSGQGSVLSLAKTKLLTRQNSGSMVLDSTFIKTEINNLGIGLSQSSTNIYISGNGAIFDVPRSISSGRMSLVTAIREGNAVVSFRLDFNAKTLSLELAYNVEIYSIDASSFTIQSTQSMLSYQLTSISGFRYVDPTILEITMSDVDVLAIQQSIPIILRTDIILQVSPSAVIDVHQFQLSRSFSVPCFFVRVSRGLPSILSFTLDLGNGLMRIEFSNPILISSVTLSSLFLCSSRQSNATIRSLQNSRVITGGLITTSLQLTLEKSGFDLSDRELVIQSNAIGLSLSTTFMFTSTGFATDYSNPPQFLNPVLQRNAIPATNLIFDRTPPLLNRFDLDMNSRRLTMYFDEAVRARSNIPSYYTLAQNPLNSLSAQRKLSFSNTSTAFSFGRMLVIELSSVDVDSMMFQAPNLCLSRSNCYLSILAGAVTDDTPFSNAIADLFFRYGMQVTNFTADITPPAIEKFDLSMQIGTCDIYFTEMIKCSSVYLPSFMFQVSLFIGSSGLSYQLSNSTQVTCSAANVKDIHLTFGVENLIVINAIPTLMKSKAATYLSLFYGGFMDQFSNNNLAIIDGFAIPVNLYTADSTRPNLLSFSVSAQASLTLVFDKPVDPTTLAISEISFQNSVPTFSKTYNLVAASLFFVDTYRLTLSIALNQDFFRISGNSDIFKNQTSTYLRVTSNTIKDFSGNSLIAVPSESALIMGPSVRNWDLDMNNKMLYLYFSDGVNASFSPRGITLQTARNLSTFVTLTTSRQMKYSGASLSSLFVELSSFDVNTMKILGVGSSILTSFLSIRFGQTRSTFGGTIVPFLRSTAILRSAALRVRKYNRDVTPPLCLYFNINLDRGLVILVFDEPIVPSSLQLSFLTLIASSVGNSATISNINRKVLSQNLTNLEIYLNENDLNALKVSYVESPLTKLLFLVGGAVDYAGNMFQGNDEYSLISVGSVVLDVTPPLLKSSILDLSSGQLILNFNEVLDSDSFFVNNVFILANSSINSADTIQLTNYSFATISKTSGLVVIDLGIFGVDLNELLADPVIAVSRNTTFLYLRGVRDLFGNKNDSRFATEISTYVPDTVNPTLNSFDFIVLNNGNVSINFYFSKPVMPSTFNCSDFVFLAAPSASPDKRVQLPQSSCIVLTTNIQSDIEIITNATIFRNEFGNSVNSSWVYIPNNPFTSDRFGNKLNSLPSVSAIPNGPAIVKYVVDVNYGFIKLIFSRKIMRNSFFDPSGIGFYSAVTSQVQYLTSTDLTMSPVFASSPENDSFALLNLDPRDVSLLKLLDPQPTKLYLVVADKHVLKDPNGFWLVPCAVTRKLTPAYFFPDVTRPNLINVTLDLSQDKLIILFDEPVSISSFRSTNFRIQPNSTSILRSTKLSGGVLSGDLNTLTIQLLPSDAATIKLQRGRSNSSLYISFTINSVADIAGNFLRSIPFTSARPIDSIVPDIFGPIMQSFALDMNSNLLTFYFSEPVRQDSINMTQMKFQSSFFSGDGAQLDLHGGEVISPDGNTMIVKLLDEDVTRIKRVPMLGRTKQLSYIIATSLAAKDIVGNGMSAILDGAALPCSSFIADVIPPTVVSYEFNSDEFYIKFTMSEPMQAARLEPTAVTIQDSRGDLSFRYTVSRFSKTGSIELSEVIVLRLAPIDMNSLKAFYPLIADSSKTWISLSAKFCVDSFGNPNVQILPSGAISPALFVPDSTHPVILYFGLNMNTLQIKLKLSEVVPIRRVKLDQAILQNCQTRRFCDWISLATANASLSFDTGDVMLTIQMPNELGNHLKYFGIGSDVQSSYLSWSDQFASDYSGNILLPHWDASVFGYSPIVVSDLNLDSTAPTLTKWFIDSNSLKIYLRFSEPVLLFNSSAISLYIGNSDGEIASPGQPLYQVEASYSFLNTQVDLAIDEFCSVWSKNDLTKICPPHSFHWFLKNSPSPFIITLFQKAFVDFAKIPNPSSPVTIASLNVETGPECGACPAGYFVSAPCTSNHDRICSACSKCAAGSYEFSECSPNQDTLCAECSTCNSGTYISASCTTKTDTVCSPCTVCSSLEYESQACLLGKNSICNSCQFCFFKDTTIRALCDNDRYYWWALENCCLDDAENQVPCRDLSYRNMVLAARNGRHQWAYEVTSPPITGSQYGLGKIYYD